MKKFTKLLLASSCLLVGTSFVPNVDFNFVESVYAEGSNYEPRDIFSEDYPDDYEVISNNKLFNRIIKELNENSHLNISYDTNNMKSHSSDDNSSESLRISLENGEEIFLKFSSEDNDEIIISYSEGPNLGLDEDSFLIFRNLVNIINPTIDEKKIKEVFSSMKEHTNNKLIEMKKLYEIAGYDILYGKSYKEEVSEYSDDVDVDLVLSSQFTTEINETVIKSNSHPSSSKDEIEEFGSFIQVSHEFSEPIENSILRETGESKLAIGENNEDSIETGNNVKEKIVEQPFNPEDFEVLDYSDIMRNRDGLKGTKHTFYAEVLQYFEDGDNAMAMLMRNGDSDMIYQAYFTSLPENRLVEGDEVDVYGILTGLKGYETVRGSENTTPVIFIDEILIKGIDY